MLSKPVAPGSDEVQSLAVEIAEFLHSRSYHEKQHTYQEASIKFFCLVYEDDAIIVARQCRQKNGITAGFQDGSHRIVIVLKNGVETKFVSTELPLVVLETMGTKSVYQFRPGQWIEHLLSLAPKVEEARQLQEKQRTELRRFQAEEQKRNEDEMHEAHFSPVDDYYS